MAHLKRLVASKHFPIERKARTFIAAPSPGPHAKNECIPMVVLLRDMLKVARSGSEARKVLNSRAVKVDGRVVADPKFPVGLFDVVEIQKLGAYYIVAPVKGILTLHTLDQKKASQKLCRVQGKTTIAGGRFQLNLHDGRNVIVAEKEAKDYSVGDSILISVPDQKIQKHLKLKEGNIGMIGRGKYAGTVGTVKEIVLVKGREPNKAILDVSAEEKQRQKGATATSTQVEEVRTIKDYIFIIGEKHPEIQLSGRKA